MKRNLLPLLAFLGMLAGVYFLAVQGARPGSGGFLCGLGAAAAAQALWLGYSLPGGRFSAAAAFALGAPAALFVACRLAPAMPSGAEAALAAAYFLLEVANASLAVGAWSRRVPGSLAFSAAFCLLVFCDVLNALRLTGARGMEAMIVPPLLAAFVLLIVGVDHRAHGLRFCPPLRLVQRMPRAALVAGAGALGCLAAAAVAYPGGAFNPCREMLSRLGRTELASIQFPACSRYFMLGLVLAAVAAAMLFSVLRGAVRGPSTLRGFLRLARGERAGRWGRLAVAAGGALNVAGLLTIAWLPEDCGLPHSAGCYAACAGGALAVLALAFAPNAGRLPNAFRKGLFWAAVGLLAVFSLLILLGAQGAIPFAPAVPTAQKAVILFFVFAVLALLAAVARRYGAGPHPVRAWGLALAAAALAGTAPLLVAAPQVPDDFAPDAAGDPAAGEAPWAPLAADELAAQGYLLSATAEAPAGAFARRDQIAAAGYAAAALGMRTPAYTEPTAEILRACIGRMLEKETWDYVKAHWLDKPWFPDPCREENVMFTGHLLQLIALYEAFTGDFRYRDPGFDFVWNTRTTVHYTVDRLVEATQRQMFANPSGGVAGEPDRVPFAGNANAQLGLALFERLGRGSWARERAKWERWAIRHFPNPVFGGGALSAAYRRSWRLMAPDGNPALDARGLLWYRPWAANARVPAALWRRAAAELDWRRFGSAPATNDAAAAEAATLVDAAARAYGDTSTAVRVEQTLEPCLERGGGSYSLRMDPAWRLGCTANRILALAFEHGSDFRRFLRGATFPGAGGGLALTAVSPAGCRVTEAYRAKDRLVLSFAGATEGGAELLLAGAPASIRVETVPERMPFEWHPGERRLVFRKVPRHIEISPRANE